MSFTRQEVQSLRVQFPVLHQQVNGRDLVYFDNAATSQKPQRVIDCLNHYYSKYNSNIHRGAHSLAAKATDAYEASRQTIANYINAPYETINFVRGVTEGINLVANTWGEANIQEGDEILLTQMEHHANIVPWQMLAERKRAIIKVLPITQDGEWDCSNLKDYINSKTKIVAFNSVSNALGTINPIHILVDAAHAVGAITVVDGAQSAPHQVIDVNEWNVDFFTFGGHKMYGPTGIGILYGKKELLENMPPWQGGGEMIREVDFAGTTYNDLPFKFEAGTPNIAGVIGLGEAVQFLKETDVSKIAAHEVHLLRLAEEACQSIEGFEMYGRSKNKTGVLSFLIDGCHAYDLGVLLDKMGIATRTGHHCCQPLMKFYGVEGTCRASFAAYNTEEEVEVFVAGVKRAVQMLRG
ncbi:MAG TPA: cysteine desulfurase CsdA [Bacteroidetes bacterium]|nr:cysteine desulfurase CsdA [Bacteroidota bacterium]